MRKLGLLLFIFVASNVMGATPSGIEIRRGGQTSTNAASPGLYLTTDGTNSYWATVSASSTNIPSYALTNNDSGRAISIPSSTVFFGATVTNLGDVIFGGKLQIFGGPSARIENSGKSFFRDVAITNGLTNQGWTVSLGPVTNYSLHYYLGPTPSRALVLDANSQITVASGTPDGTKFLRDDNTYAVPSGSGGGGTNYAGLIITNFIRNINLDFGSVTNPSLPIAVSNRFTWSPSNNPAVLSVSGSFVSGQEQTIEGTIVVTNTGITSVTLPYGGPNGEVIGIGSAPSTNYVFIKWDGTRAFCLGGASIPGWGFTSEAGVLTPTNFPGFVATNITSTTVDFSNTANKQIYNVANHLVSSLAICPTNLVVGRTLAVYFDTNMLTFDVSVTNVAANQIRWNFNIPTNGSTSFTKTNTMRAKLFLTVETNNIITADMGYYR